ncbi:MAG: relaxase/mobilization nuclease domain-containing protein [Bacteroidota bacterium]
MIAKGKSISHLSASINYALNREQALVLDSNIGAEKPNEVAKEFAMFQVFNGRCERNSLSFVISPTIEDGKALTQGKLLAINDAFLKAMKLENHQYIAFVHQNTAHKHIHLYVNRIDYEGKAYNDQFISNRASRAAEGIAQQMGLQTAKEVQELKHAKRQSVWPEMRHIKHLAHKTLAAPGVRSVEGFVAAFNKKGTVSGFRAEAYHNNEGAFQGLRFYAGEEKFKASEIDRSLGKKQLERTLGLHLDRQRGITSDKFSGSLSWDLQQAMRQDQEEWEEWKPIVPKWRKGKRRGVSIKP